MEEDALVDFKSESGGKGPQALIENESPLSELHDGIRLEKSSYEIVDLGTGEVINATTGNDLVGLFILDGEAEVASESREIEILQTADYVLLGRRQSYMLKGKSGARCKIGRVTYCFDAERASLLLKLLPPVLTIRKRGPDDAEWEWQLRLSQLIVDRRSNCRVTNAAINRRLIEIVLIGVIQQYLSRNPHLRDRITDPDLARIGPSLQAIHQSPDKPWTVGSLATLSGMSRTLFAAKFATCTGEPPARYLMRLRMERARDLLLHSNLPLATIAHRTGYGTDVAFARAFRRESGESPAQYRHSRH